ncbi:MAG: hypothetical protein P4K93_01945 [Terracidiphilus sp.]|nr:hypothetical protein [Terracidiphilus sp.]MDR3796883.1 hypothetical protein [Terracidiphilus sp.]
MVLGLALSALVLFVVPGILGGRILSAQTHVPQAAKPASQQTAAAKPVQPRRRVAARAHAASTERRPVPEAIAAPPPATPAPIWPANQPPNRARVSWDGRGLKIEASNSSLNQILHQVASETGAKLEGLTRDQRIFGSYGPGPGRDVLLKLLDGSGYNVLVIGGRDADAPVEIVLSARRSTNPQTAAKNQNRSNSEDDETPPEPDAPPDPQPHPTVRDQFAQGNDGLSADPQQFMQDILERQQKIDQQQDQQSNPQR